MSNHNEESSLIQTPQHLAVAIALGFLIPIGVALAVSQLVTSGKKPVTTESAEQASTLILPVAKVELAAGAGASSGPKSGEEVFKAACAACHDTGAAGAPKVGDAGAWGPRLGKGLDGLLKVAIAGKGAMPAKGGNPSLSDLELARAIVLMANKSGGNLKEPAAK